jgi:uncharacterized membrane protein YozB (DUF420 family)
VISIAPAALLAFGISDLPAVNAMLNAAATVLLVAGYALIKGRREAAHRNTMLAAFGVSVAFLACYLTYHLSPGNAMKKFAGPPPISYAYYTILITHIFLAATVPFLALATIYLGLRDRRAAHRRLARWTFPIWLYVSVTGVVIYVMLYHLYPPSTSGPIMQGPSTPPASASADKSMALLPNERCV